jgi:N-acetylmuramic acid 6-phosphate etherase
MSAEELVELIGAEDRTVPDAVGREGPAISRAVEIVAERFRRGGRLFYVGAGTSGRLGVLDAAECPPTFGSDPEMVQGLIAGGHGALIRAREGAEDRSEDGAHDLTERGVGPDDIVFGIATSGVTPYVLGALEEARRVGAATVFLSCARTEGNSVPVDVTITPLVGPEVVTGSTRMKAGTATKLVLNTVTTSAMVLLGKTYENLMVDLTASCDKLRDRGCRILMEVAGVDYDGAADVIGRAGGSVKTAIVMEMSGLDRERAEAVLRANRGSVRRALGSGGGA